MKKMILFIVIISSCYFSKAQILFGGNYKRFIPASDTSKYVYKTGGGVEAMAGLGLGKGGITAVITGSIDVFKINHKTNSESKDGWLTITGGLRKDFVFGHAKKAGLGEDVSKSFFLTGNYGVSASNYTARVTNDAKKSLSTKIWNVGAGVHLAGFELAYFYHNLQDVKRSSWMPLHQFKIGLAIFGK